MNRLEKQDLKDLHLMLIVLGVVICSAVAYASGHCAGKENKQEEIEQRANKIYKQSYDNFDVELIIFGERQL